MESRDQRDVVKSRTGLVWGARPLLFDRLCGDPLTGPPRVLDVDGMLQSIDNELRALMNTRLAEPVALPGNMPETVVAYGMPDFSALSPTSPADRRLLAEVVARKVAVFEPRLRDVAVVFEPDPDVPTRLIGRLSANMPVGSVRIPVRFKIAHTRGNAMLQEPVLAARDA